MSRGDLTSSTTFLARSTSSMTSSSWSVVLYLPNIWHHPYQGSPSWLKILPVWTKKCQKQVQWSDLALWTSSLSLHSSSGRFFFTWRDPVSKMSFPPRKASLPVFFIFWSICDHTSGFSSSTILSSSSQRTPCCPVSRSLWGAKTLRTCWTTAISSNNF